MTYPETLPDTAAQSDPGHITDHNLLATAVGNIDSRLHTVETNSGATGVSQKNFDVLQDLFTNGSLKPPTAMVSPPTVTVSAPGASTALSGTLATYQPNNSAFRYSGMSPINIGTLGAFSNCYRQNSATDSTSGTKQNRMRFEFETDATDFEVVFRSETIGARFRVWVDGQYANSHAALTTTAIEYRRVRIQFASAKVRLIVIEAQEVSFCGLFIPQTRSIWKTNRDIGPRCVAMTDSYGYGIDITAGNPTWYWDAYPVRAGRALGWDVHPNSIGWTGFVAGNSNGQPTFGQRLTSDVLNLNPDIVFVAGSQNDGENNITTAANSLFSNIRTALPNARIIGFSGVASIWQLYTGIQISGAAIQTAVASVGGDFINGLDWCGGNGSAYAPNGTGNADFYSDANYHMTVEGYTYVADRLTSALSSLYARRAN